MEMGHFPIYVVLIAALGFVSSQGTIPNLGIFNVPFKIVLIYRDPADTTTEMTTLAISSIGATVKAQVASSSSSSASSATSLIPSSTASPVASSTTSSATTVTVAAQNPFAVVRPLVDLDTVSNALLIKLDETFSGVPVSGYLSTSHPAFLSNTSITVTFGYEVVFDKTVLNNEGLLQPNSAFFTQLYAAIDDILRWDWNTTLTDGFVVDDDATRTEMANSIFVVNQNFADVEWLCTGATCDLNVTECVVTDRVYCSDKCPRFEAENSCTKEPQVAGVYVSGTCKIDKNGNAYCDCGMSPGDIMNNFFDGHQCVSVTFIVAMAASAGGFLLLLLLIALCVICDRKGSKKTASSRASRASSPDVYATHNGHHEPHPKVEVDQRKHSKDHGSPKEYRRSSSFVNGAYEVTREPHTKLEVVDQRQHSKDYGSSPKDYRRLSSFNVHGYDVTKEGPVEFKSIRL